MAANEDFTTYDVTEETGSTFTITPSRVSWVTLSRTDTSHVSDSKGANYFDGDFVHEFEMEYSNDGGFAVIAHWGLANVQKDIKSIEDDADDGVFLMHVATSYRIAAFEGGSGPLGIISDLDEDTHYYVRIVRDDDGGVNNQGRITAYVFTGGFDDTLIGSNFVDFTAHYDFEYVYACTSYDSDDNITVDGFTENLDLHAKQDYTREDISSLASDDTNLGTDFSTSDYTDVAS